MQTGTSDPQGKGSKQSAVGSKVEVRQKCWVNPDDDIYKSITACIFVAAIQ